LEHVQCTSKRTASGASPSVDHGQGHVTIEGGPHNIAWTHPEECNKALLDFLGEG
jgi:pimeloyl-ACP methyl ester carboxylesterase